MFDDWAKESEKATNKIKGHLQSTGDKMQGTSQRMSVASNGAVQSLKEVGTEAESTSSEGREAEPERLERLSAH